MFVSYWRTRWQIVPCRIVSTFILVLDWWVDNDTVLSSVEVDDVFLSLVVPTLTSQIDGEGSS